ncbi:MAG: ComEA family DNA-binding protein, partial [Betaproteobacteria bacterium]
MKKLLLAVVMLFVSALSFAAVNINTATEAELESLKGIGPVKAKAIIEDRTKNGPFKSVEDLDRVKGIGMKTIDSLRKDLAVSGAT